MRAGAKINLMLHATDRRADGYHLLQSLVMFADFGDDITLAPSEDFSLHVTGEFADSLHGDNLVTTAAHALARACNLTPHGSITLEKKLPVGSGLGGGSADAAAALHLLEAHWSCNFSLSRLQHIAAPLGSDIPACLLNAPLWMEGAGEHITPLSVPFNVPVLLANPRIALSTQDVYRKLAPPYAAPLALPSEFSSLPDLVGFLYMTHNVLEAPAKLLEPVIDEMIRDMTVLPGSLLARMSGSGATCFSIFPTQEACASAADVLQQIHPGWWIQPTTLKGSHG